METTLLLVNKLTKEKILMDSFCVLQSCQKIYISMNRWYGGGIQPPLKRLPDFRVLSIIWHHNAVLKLYQMKWGSGYTYSKICMVGVLGCGGQMMFVRRSGRPAQEVGGRIPGTPSNSSTVRKDILVVPAPHYPDWCPWEWAGIRQVSLGWILEPSRNSWHRSLRSSSSLSICIHTWKTAMAKSKSFSSVAWAIWKKLPCHLSSFSALPAFKKRLEHHPFSSAFPDISSPSTDITLCDVTTSMNVNHIRCTLPPS